MTLDHSLCDAVTFDDVRDAATRLEGVVHRTPVMTSRSLDAMAGCSVHLKCENLQRVGAFKIRGGYNALSRLPDDCRGVLTYSSGNHAQAVALSAQLLGIPAIVIMPDDAPVMKKRATAGYLEGAPGDSRVVEYDRAETTREDLASSMLDELGYTLIPPYDHPHVIAGQGTASLELFEEAGPLDALFVPCGGGGLLTGSATVARALHPSCQVIGVEPDDADDACRSFRTRELHTVEHCSTIADGARTPSLGRYTFALAIDRVDEMMSVPDEALVEVMRFVWSRMKIVIEPTAALGLAGLLRRRDEFRGRRVGAIFTGGNVDLTDALDLMRD